MLLCAMLAPLCACAAEDGFPGFTPLGDPNRMTDPRRWGELNTHDPAILKEGDRYYVFSTDASYGDLHKPGIQVRVSTDLITWEYLGTAFADFERDCAEVIAYAKLDPLKKQGLWAPDVVKVGEVYRMYFSASTFGSSRSCIALAEAGRPEGPYVYRGIVVRSYANALNGANAIDPSIATDAQGNQWMSYGSFFGGIFLQMLDAKTGMLPDPPAKPVRIAGSRGAAIEGSCIVYTPGSQYYYLFVSCGSLSSNYNIRVGRSREITGPYVDASGRDLNSLGAGYDSTIGVKLMGGFTFLSDPGVLPTKGTMAPGHNDVLMDGGDYFLVHHARTFKLPDYWFTMNVRRFFMNRFDWPVAAPNRYTGEKLEPASIPDGAYGLVFHLDDTNEKSRDSVGVALHNGEITGAVTGSYRVYDQYHVALLLDGEEYDGFVLKQYDWERKRDVIAFTAMSEKGQAVWGGTLMIE